MCNKYVLLFLLVCAVVFSAAGQTNPADSLTNTPADTVQLPADTLQLPADSIHLSSVDTLLQVPAPDTTAAANQSDISTTINYNASDSIRFDISDRTVFMYGNAKVDYGQIKLEAAHITTNWATNMLSAVGAQDSLGKTIGKPVFTDGPEEFVTDNIRYNFKTKKAIIKGIVTQQQEAFIHGETVKKSPDNELYISQARYTTCNLEHPHFHIEAEKLKVLPNDKIISGPFHLKVADISTPLGFLFGMFPAPRKRTSGIIMPSYGEEQRRGFFLREGGYYFALNEYVDLAVTGEIYTKGSRGIQLASTYRKRYAYNGNFNVRYNRQNTGNEAFDNITNDVWVNWSHSPQTKGKGRFSASVNGGTSSYTTNNPSLRNMEQNMNQQFSSNLSYSYNNIFNSPFSFSSRANMTQDVARKTVDLTLPDISVMMNRQFPFKRQGSSGKTWYEQISVGYSFNATNRLTNKPPSRVGNFPVINMNPVLTDSVVAFNLDNLPIIFDRARIGGRHTIPVTTSFNVLKHFQVSPSFNYEEFWFPKRFEYAYIPEQEGVRVDTVNGFSRAGVWNASTGVSTKVFGTFYFNRRNKTPLIQAVRHLMIPTVGFSYRPDFTREQFGYFENIQTGFDRNEDPLFQQLSVYQGSVYTIPAGREQGALNFSLTNNLEMKVRSKSDTATEYKKVPIIKNLSISTSYDLIAEEFNLSPLRMSGNTSLFENLISLNFGGTLNPYAYELEGVSYDERTGTRRVDQTRINSYAWNEGQGIGRIEQANFGITTSLNSNSLKKGGGKANTTPGVSPSGEGPTGTSTVDEDIAYIYDNPHEYVDFTLPWTLRFSYQFNYSKPGFADSRITQSTNFSGDLKITDKWKLGFNSGFDLQQKQFTMTNLSIYRDLHCWQMNVNWSPFGYTQSFSVDINVKASVLQDLKLSRRRTFFDN